MRDDTFPFPFVEAEQQEGASGYIAGLIDSIMTDQVTLVGTVWCCTNKNA